VAGPARQAVGAGQRWAALLRAQVGGEIEISQRLKRFSTIVDKLRREPTMQLTTMEDIGGVRAILRNQALVDEVAPELRTQPRWKVRRVREYVTGRDLGPRPMLGEVSED
jgi:ppGpp synthetase/RelA/SpoT-type nucleotidyltranferase